MDTDLSVRAVLGKEVPGALCFSWICVVGKIVLPQRLSRAGVIGEARTMVAAVARRRVNAVWTMLAV
jgi:hypothetical protein